MTVKDPTKHITTLPCVIFMSENWRQFETGINDKSQGSVATCCGTFNSYFFYQFTANSALKVFKRTFFKNRLTSIEIKGNDIDFLKCPVCPHSLMWKDEEFARATMYGGML